MRLLVDLTRCQGYGQCAFHAPGAFVMYGDEALMYDPDPDEAQRASILRAAAACPVQAIQLDRADAEPATRAEPATSAEPATGAEPARREDAFRRTGRIVIVGASLAGLRAAETLRAEGFAGSLTMIGAEPYPPYDRPPLSKQVLGGLVEAQRTALPGRRELDAHWRLGVPAVGLDLAGRQVYLADSGRVGFDRLLIAPGSGATDAQRNNTPDLRCCATVTKLDGDPYGRLRRAYLSDGGAGCVQVA